MLLDNFTCILKNRVVITALLLLFSISVVSGAEIADIVVETPSGESIPRGLITGNVNSLPGTEFNPETLSQDIQRLYKSKYFENVETRVQEEDDDEVTVVFEVDPVPRMAEVNIRGNEFLDTGDIRKKITIEKGDLVNPDKISESRQAIVEYYREKGYYGTSVAVNKTVADDGDRVSLTFDIDESRRVKLDDVEFVGTTVFKDGKLIRQMKNNPTFWSWFFPVGFYNPGALQMDKMRLRRLYANAGYIDFRITDIEKKYSDNGKWVTLQIFVNEGQPYSVDSVEITGNKLFGNAELKRHIQLAPLVTYSPELRSRDRQSLRSLYQPLGYLDMSVNTRMEKNSEEGTVDIVYEISEGQPSHVRNINIRGNVKTQDRVIRRELKLQPGDLANANKIQASKNSLQNLNYFKKVNIVPKSTTSPSEKDLQVDVKEKKTGQMMVGAGFSTEDDVVGTLQVTQRNFDWNGWPDFTGAGQRMQLSLQVGTEQNNANLRFVEPWWLGRRLRLELNAFRTERDEDNYDRKRTGAGASLTWQLKKFWRQTVGLQIEEVTLEDFTSGSTARLLEEKGTYEVVSLRLTTSRDTRNRVIYPTRGSRLELRGEFQPEALGSYGNIYKLKAKGVKYFPLLFDFIFKLEGQLGVVDHLGDERVAIFDRFFAGGTSTFRGFERREISPVDSNEEPLGGKSMLLGTAELTYPFTRSVRASMFCDAGNVWSGSYDMTPTELNASVGVGVELRLPIGPIRIDYGIPVVTEQAHLDDSGRLHFGLSYGF